MSDGENRRYELIPSYPTPIPSDIPEHGEVEGRRGVTGTGNSYSEHDVHNRRGVPGTGTRSEYHHVEPPHDYSETNIGYIHPSQQSRSHHTPDPGYPYTHSRRASNIRSAYDGDIKSQYPHSTMGKLETGGGGGEMQSMEHILKQVLENPEGLSNIIQTVLSSLQKEGGNMSQELGTAALAALVGKSQDGLGGLGSGLLGGALGALLLGAIGRGGVFGGAGIGAAAPILTELEIQNAVSTIKDHVGNVKGDVAELFAQHQQAEVVKGIDDKLANMHAHINSQVGHLAEKIEHVQSFLTLQQKDAEINALRDKNQVYAEELNNQRLAHLLRETREQVSVQVRNSHDSIHSTVRAILPLLVPAAAGGGNNIPVDRVTQIVNAIAAMADNQAEVNSINVRTGNAC